MKTERQFDPIKKINLSQRLVDYFIQQIESGDFPIGERVPNEINLAGQLNVSRNILRESMKILENYGILHTVNGKGTVVSSSAMANIQSMRFFEKLRNDISAQQMLEARQILEPRITYYACRRCTEDDVAQLRKIVALSMETRGPDARSDDYDFHLAIARICGNEMLTEFLYTMICHLRNGDYSQFNRYVESILQEKSLREHEEIVEAFARGDPAAASRTMETHLRDRIHIIRTLYSPETDVNTLRADALMDAMHLAGSAAEPAG